MRENEIFRIKSRRMFSQCLLLEDANVSISTDVSVCQTPPLLVCLQKQLRSCSSAGPGLSGRSTCANRLTVGSNPFPSVSGKKKKEKKASISLAVSCSPAFRLTHC